VGSYPYLDTDLRIPETHCYVAGDACGIFRGIIAGMISGFYVGELVRRELQKSMNND